MIVTVAISALAAAAFLPAVTAAPPPPPFPWFNPSLPTKQRAAALVAAIPVEERVAQLVVDAPAIPGQVFHTMPLACVL